MVKPFGALICQEINGNGGGIYEEYLEWGLVFYEMERWTGLNSA